jgi:hypothetical protein
MCDDSSIKTALENAYMFFSTYPAVLREAKLKVARLELQTKQEEKGIIETPHLELTKAELLSLAKAELDALESEKVQHETNILRFKR